MVETPASRATSGMVARRRPGMTPLYLCNVTTVMPSRRGRAAGSPTGTEFRRDRLTWTAYVVLAWFAYLQAAPGLVIVHLRDELGLSYSTGGLHVAAFAAGSMVAGVVAAWIEGAGGRRALFWSAASLRAAGAVGLTAGRVAAATVGSTLVMGLGGGLLLVTIQAAL